MKVYFDILELYYLPQYLPIAKELGDSGVELIFIFRSSCDRSSAEALLERNWRAEYVEASIEVVQICNSEQADWLIIGNSFSEISMLDEQVKTALVGHGIGPKSCYYTVSDTPTTVRFVEGPYRLERLEKMYPKQAFVDTGYAKLDPVINNEYQSLRPSDYGLDDRKKTVLYAPAFFPSSIEVFSKRFPEEFSEYNIILKPHYFSMSSPKYIKQKEMLKRWAGAPNVYLAQREDINLVPFMVVADVLISDASSALFEFAALDKPVVWCDFYYLRWSYRGPFSFRFKDRMDKDLYKYSDIAKHVDCYGNLKSVVDSQIYNPDEYSQARKEHTLNLAGVVDGKASQRIADYLIQNCSAP